MWLRFWHVIKMMTGVENILNNEEFFRDTVHTQKEGIQQHRKREYSSSVISKGKER